jgi:hypothetical protein
LQICNTVLFPAIIICSLYLYSLPEKGHADFRQLFIFIALDGVVKMDPVNNALVYDPAEAAAAALEHIVKGTGVASQSPVQGFFRAVPYDDVNFKGAGFQFALIRQIFILIVFKRKPDAVIENILVQVQEFVDVLADFHVAVIAVEIAFDKIYDVVFFRLVVHALAP